MHKCSSAPSVSPTLRQVTQCIQEYHVHVCGTLVRKECESKQMQQIRSRYCNPVTCLYFHLTHVS
ncbi:hypothetical protein GmHk_12G034703 [Glycine max]|nr:hypothetical protein GmHk_12G034703 [Glycine max]